MIVSDPILDDNGNGGFSTDEGAINRCNTAEACGGIVDHGSGVQNATARWSARLPSATVITYAGVSFWPYISESCGRRLGELRNDNQLYKPVRKKPLAGPLWGMWRGRDDRM